MAVARDLGVSPSTVSNAYNRPDQLSPALRERVLSTAAKLGYAGPMNEYLGVFWWNQRVLAAGTGSVSTAQVAFSGTFAESVWVESCRLSGRCVRRLLAVPGWDERPP